MSLDNVVPFLQQLIQRIKAKPDAELISFMERTEVKELRIFFDALASGQSDQDTYDKIVDYVRARHQQGYVAKYDHKALGKKPAAPPPEPTPPRSSAPNSATRQNSDIKEITVEAVESATGYDIILATPGKDAATVTVDFAGSSNLSLKPCGPAQQISALKIELSIPPNVGPKKVQIASLTVVPGSTSANLNFQTLVRGAGEQAPPEHEPDEVVPVAEGLTVIVRSTDSGYDIYARNDHNSRQYSVSIDLSESQNLTVKAAPSVTQSGDTCSRSIGAMSGEVKVAVCSVKDYRIGSCDVRYKVSAREE